MKRIALVTYEISPYKGSEFSVSWNYVFQMSRDNKITVLYSTNPYGRRNDDVKHWLKNNSNPNVDFVHCDSLNFVLDHVPWKYLPLGRRFRGLLYRNLWQKKIKKLLVQMVQKREIDLIHLLNPIGFLSLMNYRWGNFGSVPLVCGAVQGVEILPFKVVFSHFKVNKNIGFLFDYFVRKFYLLNVFKRGLVKETFAKANCIFAATPNTFNQIKEYHKLVPYCCLPENGVVQLETDTPIFYNKGELLELTWCGSVDVRKNLQLLLDALSNIQKLPWHLNVVGSGPMEKKMVDFSKKRGFFNKCTFFGNVSREKVQEIFKKTHLHCLTSLREGNPTVIWEAMSKGVPTLTIDHCGMSFVTTPKDSVQIRLDTFSKMSKMIANCIKNILDNPKVVSDLSKNSLKRAEYFSWQRRVFFLNHVYNEILKE